MPQSNDHLTTIDMLMDALIRLDTKIESLETRMDEHYKDLRQVLDRRVEDLSERVTENTLKIAKHEHNFNVVTFLIGGGIAGIAGWFTGFQNFFTGKTH